jgi:hypothetical protein
MFVTIMIAVLPYCTPQKDPLILAACLNYFAVCLQGSLEYEEACSENLDWRLSP